MSDSLPVPFKNSIRPNNRKVLTVKSQLVFPIRAGLQSLEHEGRLHFGEGQAQNLRHREIEFSGSSMGTLASPNTNRALQPKSERSRNGQDQCEGQPLRQPNPALDGNGQRGGVKTGLCSDYNPSSIAMMYSVSSQF
jgi:hypothetical protein